MGPRGLPHRKGHLRTKMRDSAYHVNQCNRLIVGQTAGDPNIGFSQQHRLFRCVEICVFGDGVQGKGRPSPASAIEKPQDGLISVFFRQRKDLHWLCKRMRMKVSAGFLQWEPSRRPSVTSLIAKHVMFEIRISSRGARFASETNTQMKSGTRW